MTTFAESLLKSKNQYLSIFLLARRGSNQIIWVRNRQLQQNLQLGVIFTNPIANKTNEQMLLNAIFFKYLKSSRMLSF